MTKSPQQQRGNARTKVPVRNQIEMRCLSLDQMLAGDHRARVVWEYALACNLTPLYERIRAVEGHVGRDAVDPRLLFALWLYATLEGVTSARRLELLTQTCLPYQWLCGGVSVNYHRLADFRVEHGELLERLMIDSVAVLLHQELITLESIGQDGMRVRAHAGSSSFRRAESLEEAFVAATEHVERLQQQQQDDPSGDERRSQAAQKRAAQERQQRLEQAQAELRELNEQREQRRGTKTSTPRASTTDPHARRMKMADNGFRPAYNVQFATDAQTRIIVGVEVTNQGPDFGLLEPMYQRLIQNYGTRPQQYLVDGGFVKKEDITALETAGTAVHAPVPREKRSLKTGRNPYVKQRGETPQMAAFRERMGTTAAKEVYQTRPSIAEFPNAECCNRGLRQFVVRGLKKVKAQSLWYVLAFNFLRFANLDFWDHLTGEDTLLGRTP